MFRAGFCISADGNLNVMEHTAAATEGWAADTTRPLGAIPVVFAAVCAAVVANVVTMPQAISAAAWGVFGFLVFVLLVRGVRWLKRELDASRIEHHTTHVLARDARLVPLRQESMSRPAYRELHKAS